jgi:hypothetical protein
MQDLESGDMVPIDPKLLERFGVEQWIGELDRQLQTAKDEAIPERANQGPVFSVGEELEIRGGRFRVHAITEKRIYLDSLPRKK